MNKLLLFVLFVMIVSNATLEEHKPIEPKEPVTQVEFALQMFSKKQAL